MDKEQKPAELRKESNGKLADTSNKVGDLDKEELMRMIQSAVSAANRSNSISRSPSFAQDDYSAGSVSVIDPKSNAKSKARATTQVDAFKRGDSPGRRKFPTLKRSASMLTNTNPQKITFVNPAASKLVQENNKFKRHSVSNVAEKGVTFSRLRSNNSDGGQIVGQANGNGINSVQLSPLNSPASKGFDFSQVDAAPRSPRGSSASLRPKLQLKGHYEKFYNKLNSNIQHEQFDYVTGVENADPGKWIICAGLLQKKRDGKLREGWAHRFFVLTNKRLLYYLVPKKFEKHLLGEDRGSIRLADMVSIMTSNTKDGFFIHIDVNNSGVRKSTAMNQFQNVQHLTLWSEHLKTGSTWAQAICDARANAMAASNSKHLHARVKPLGSVDTLSENFDYGSDSRLFSSSDVRHRIKTRNMRRLSGESNGSSSNSSTVSSQIHDFDLRSLNKYNSESSIDSSLLKDDLILQKQQIIDNLNWKNKYHDMERKLQLAASTMEDCTEILDSTPLLYKPKGENNIGIYILLVSNIVFGIIHLNSDSSWLLYESSFLCALAIALLIRTFMNKDDFKAQYKLIDRNVARLKTLLLDSTKALAEREEQEDDSEEKSQSTFAFSSPSAAGVKAAKGADAVNFNANLSSFSNDDSKVLPGQTSVEGFPTDGKTDHLYNKKYFWENAVGTEFNVRTGPNYSKNKLKCTSEPAFYDVVATDLVKDKVVVEDLLSKFQIPKPRQCDDLGKIRQAKVPRILVVNLQMFLESPSFLGRQDDDPGVSFVQYCAIKPEIVQRYIDGDISPAMKLFREYIQNHEAEHMKKRFKGIAIVENMDELRMLKKLQGYNGKPFIMNKSLTLKRVDKKDYEYFLIEVNIRYFGFVAKKLMYSFMDELKNLKIVGGALIQSEEDEEMPENMLFAFKVQHIDLHKHAVPLEELQ